MPDPVLYGKGIFAAAGASALVVLALGGVRRPASATRLSFALVVGIAAGLFGGFYVLEIRPAWPPTSALARLITIILPAVIGIELAASFDQFPRRLVWGLRIGLTVVTGRVLLRGSVYVDGRSPEWTAGQMQFALGACALMLAGEWWALHWLSWKTAAASIPIALAEAVFCAGMTTMMAGYLRGGEAALPLVATLVSATGALWLVADCRNVAGAIGPGVIGLFGFLMIGRFFGGLSTLWALTIYLSPLLCLVTEIPSIRKRSPWIVGVLRLGLVALPLLVVLADAKQEFDKQMGPLLETKAEQILQKKGTGTGRYTKSARKINVRRSQSPFFDSLLCSLGPATIPARPMTRVDITQPTRAA